MEFGNIDSYNKGGAHKTHGTLVGNWYEEAKLKEETGQSRLTFPSHTKKSHKELFDETKVFQGSSTCSKNSLSTGNRIFGTETSMKLETTNSLYGKSVNPADKLPQVGKRNIELQKQVSTCL